MSTRTRPLLELRGVTAAYESIRVLHGVDLSVPEGSVFALLGANGAGKSTTLRVIAGQHPPTGGEILLAGHPVDGIRSDDLARAGVCFVPEGRGVFPNLSVRDHLIMASYTGVPVREIEEAAYARFPRLGERRRQLAGTLSGGEQQMLAMARALTTDPALLLLDELSMGLAPLIVEELYEQVAAVAAEGVSIVVVEQFARTVLGVATHAAVMAHGRVLAEGRPGEIEDALSTAYLGADH